MSLLCTGEAMQDRPNATSTVLAVPTTILLQALCHAPASEKVPGAVMEMYNKDSSTDLYFCLDEPSRMAPFASELNQKCRHGLSPLKQSDFAVGRSA